jgi:hypothetical protein
MFLVFIEINTKSWCILSWALKKREREREGGGDIQKHWPGRLIKPSYNRKTVHTPLTKLVITYMINKHMSTLVLGGLAPDQHAFIYAAKL